MGCDVTTTGLGKAAGVGVRYPDGKSFVLIPLLLGNSWRLWLRLWALMLIG